jgi:hypothetical protein
MLGSLAECFLRNQELFYSNIKSYSKIHGFSPVLLNEGHGNILKQTKFQFAIAQYYLTSRFVTTAYKIFQIKQRI